MRYRDLLLMGNSDFHGVMNRTFETLLGLAAP